MAKKRYRYNRFTGELELVDIYDENYTDDFVPYTGGDGETPPPPPPRQTPSQSKSSFQGSAAPFPRSGPSPDKISSVSKEDAMQMKRRQEEAAREKAKQEQLQREELLRRKATTDKRKAEEEAAKRKAEAEKLAAAAAAAQKAALERKRQRQAEEAKFAAQKAAAEEEARQYAREAAMQYEMELARENAPVETAIEDELAMHEAKAKAEAEAIKKIREERKRLDEAEAAAKAKAEEHQRLAEARRRLAEEQKQEQLRKQEAAKAAEEAKKKAEEPRKNSETTLPLDKTAVREEAARIVASWGLDRNELGDDQYIEILHEKLGQYIVEALSMRGVSQRLQADFDNFRKRNADIQREMKELGISMVVEKILPVLDNFSRAKGFIKDNNSLMAFNMMEGQIINALVPYGLEEIDPEGLEFDPNLMSSMDAERAPGMEGKVLSVMSKGFMINGKVIRPAGVKVGK